MCVKTEKTRKNMECLLRWKARKIGKSMKMELRRPRSAVGCAFSDLQPLKMQVIVFLVQSDVSQPEMVPKWSQNGVGNTILEGSIFDANFKVNFLNSGLPSPPPEAGTRGGCEPATGEVK